MTSTLETRLEITSWIEETLHEMADGSKITRAAVSLSGGGNGLSAAATFDAVMFYRPDGTSSYVSIMHVMGALQGREGLEEALVGRNDDGDARLLEHYF